MANLFELSIKNILDDLYPTYSVKKRRKDIVNFYITKFQIDLFGDAVGDGGKSITEDELGKKIDSILREDKQSADPFLTYSNGFYRKARRKGSSITPSTLPDSNYLGKGGECLVMGELLFRGYNVNSMVVDEGIDLVACKDNVFFYVQVKTKTVQEQNRFYFQIKQERFDSFLGTQIRYILVARCSKKGEELTIFFTFTNNDVQRFLYNGAIPQPAEGSNNLSIKIEYDPRTNKAILYDGKFREDVTFFMNNFNL